MPFYILEVFTRHEDESFAFIERSKDSAVKESERILSLKSEHGEFSDSHSKIKAETASLYTVVGRGFRCQNYSPIARWDITPTKNKTKKHKFVIQYPISVS